MFDHTTKNAKIATSHLNVVRDGEIAYHAKMDTYTMLRHIGDGSDLAYVSTICAFAYLREAERRELELNKVLEDYYV